MSSKNEKIKLKKKLKKKLKTKTKKKTALPGLEPASRNFKLGNSFEPFGPYRPRIPDQSGK